MESYYKRQQVYQNTAYKRLNNAAEDELGIKIKKMPKLEFKKSFYNIFNPETPVSDWVNEKRTSRASTWPFKACLITIQKA